jgi:hypothetical protein
MLKEVTCRWVVSEWWRCDWREFAVVPAISEAGAVAKARNAGLRPKDRRMKARKLKVTKQ